MMIRPIHYDNWIIGSDNCDNNDAYGLYNDNHMMFMSHIILTVLLYDRMDFNYSYCLFINMMSTMTMMSMITMMTLIAKRIRMILMAMINIMQ